MVVEIDVIGCADDDFALVIVEVDGIVSDAGEVSPLAVGGSDIVVGCLDNASDVAVGTDGVQGWAEDAFSLVI